MTRRDLIEFEFNNKPIWVESKLIVEIFKKYASPRLEPRCGVRSPTHLKSRQVFNESDGQKENECYDPVQTVNRIVHMTWLPIHWFLLPAWLTRIDTPVP